MFFVIMSMFLSIVDQSYNFVREQLSDMGNTEDILVKDLRRTRRYLWRSAKRLARCVVTCGRKRRDEAKVADDYGEAAEAQRAGALSEARETALNSAAASDDPAGLGFALPRLQNLERQQAELAAVLGRIAGRGDF